MDNIQKNFEKFHQDNPQVYQYFCQFAYEMYEAGYRRASAGLIFERIRWEMNVVRGDSSPPGETQQQLPEPVRPSLRERTP